MSFHGPLKIVCLSFSFMPAALYPGSIRVESSVLCRHLELEARRLKSDPLMDLQRQLCPIANVP